jgi:hypothetical protein
MVLPHVFCHISLLFALGRAQTLWSDFVRTGSGLLPPPPPDMFAEKNSVQVNGGSVEGQPGSKCPHQSEQKFKN